MKYICNAMSLGMLDCLSEHPVSLKVNLLTEVEARYWVRQHRPESSVGHADTALLLTGILQTPIELRRASTSLCPGDQLLVAQYNGPRLPEGAKSLPEGATLRWILVKVERDLDYEIFQEFKKLGLPKSLLESTG